MPLSKLLTQIFATLYYYRPYDQYIKFSRQPQQLPLSLQYILAKAVDVASIVILLAAYTHDLQVGVYARNQKLLYRGKYRQEARNRPQIEPVTFTKQRRKGWIFKAIGVLNASFIYTYIITLYSQAYLELPLLIITARLYIFSLQYTPKLLNSLLINSRNGQQYSCSQSLLGGSLLGGSLPEGSLPRGSLP